MATEQGPEGGRVNAVAPGFVHTDMGAAELEIIAQETSVSVEEATEQAVATIALRRLGSADDVADALGWLASGAWNVTGAVIPIDGGSGR
ncbi:SDR family oxidoreductase [Nocardia sp. CA-120079]|uniref:SDR family oxidoreductase n=1 Tax=Nocardia sp. CA-120079 TaxID=3239974 RepID=UPI003D958C03